MQILCEINYLHETKTQVTIKETDSSFAKISYYIDNHLFENITLEKLANGVFVGKVRLQHHKKALGYDVSKVCCDRENM